MRNPFPFRSRFLLPLLMIPLTKITLANPIPLEGPIKLDGSSTVFPISEAMAEEFQRIYPKTRVTVGISGTGGGFKKFLHKEVDITAASRPISESEIALAKNEKIPFHEITIALDGITVVVHKDNPIESLSLAQLKALWEPSSKIKTWRDLDPSLPAQAIRLYGPGSDSGTFDHFTQVVMGKSKSSRSDYTASEDDNIMIKGISQDKFALGYFGFAYFEENQKVLKALKISKDKQPIMPSVASIKELSYPLARPLFLYTSWSAWQKPQVKGMLQFYLESAEILLPQTGFISFDKAHYQKEFEKLTSWQDPTKQNS